ncbi:MAG: hypothetical protein IJR45_08465 [Firmicutes bacterium]|nr:hypothetical protein [Bacillota bacterium]MBQ9605430.1 hypothetical protein [Bacillota bacterium]
MKSLLKHCKKGKTTAGTRLYPLFFDKFSTQKVITIFYTNTEEEKIEVENRSIITIEQAIRAVEEFFVTEQLPKCVDWEEL